MINRQIKIGSVSAEGYVIRKAHIFITSSDEIENPDSNVEVEIMADLVWVNRSEEHWHTVSEARLRVDIDKERFLMDDLVVEIINGKKIFNKIMRVLVSSLKTG